MFDKERYSICVYFVETNITYGEDVTGKGKMKNTVDDIVINGVWVEDYGDKNVSTYFPPHRIKKVVVRYLGEV